MKSHVAKFLAPFCPRCEKCIVVLLLEVPIEGLIIYLGSLGDYIFHQKVYAYVGSNYDEGSRARASSLWRWKKSHIEYFLSNPFVRLIGKCCRPAQDSLSTHSVAGRLRWYGVAVKGFEVYDCHCESHLIRVEELEGLKSELHKMGFECDYGEDALRSVGPEVLEFMKRRAMAAEKSYGHLLKEYMGSKDRGEQSF